MFNCENVEGFEIIDRRTYQERPVLKIRRWSLFQGSALFLEIGFLIGDSGRGKNGTYASPAKRRAGIDDEAG